MAIKKIFVRTPYNYDVDKASHDSGFSCTGESLTKQSFKDECDINNIVARFGIGAPILVPAKMPTYGDFVGVNDYKSALDAVMAADDVFMALPPNIRERFNNDPAALVDFCSDSSNRDEAMKLGLIPSSESVVGSPSPTPDPKVTSESGG